MERFEEKKQTRGGRVLMIGNTLWVIIPFEPEVGNQPHKSREPTKLGTQTEMLRTSHSAKTCEASAQTSVNGEVPGLSGGFRVIGRFSGLKAT